MTKPNVNDDAAPVGAAASSAKSDPQERTGSHGGGGGGTTTARKNEGRGGNRRDTTKDGNRGGRGHGHNHEGGRGGGRGCGGRGGGRGGAGRSNRGGGSEKAKGGQSQGDVNVNKPVNPHKVSQSHSTGSTKHKNDRSDRNRRDGQGVQVPKEVAAATAVDTSQTAAEANNNNTNVGSSGTQHKKPNKNANRNRRRGADSKQRHNNHKPSTMAPSSSVPGTTGVDDEVACSEEMKRLREEEERKAKEAAEAEQLRQRLRTEYLTSEKSRLSRLKANVACLKSFQSVIEWHSSNRAKLTTPSILNAKRLEHANERKKNKSDLKKCTAFVKKVKTSTSFQMAGTSGGSAATSTTGLAVGSTATTGSSSTTPTPTPVVVTSVLSEDDMMNHPLLKDVKSLNLSRFVDEIAASLIDAKFKVTEVPVVVALCCGLHERYKEFLPALLPKLLSHIQQTNVPSSSSSSSNVPGADNNDDEQGKGGAMKQRRVLLRLFTELVLNGVVLDPKPLVKIVSEAAGAPKSSSSQPTPSYHVTDVHLLSSFVKSAGMELLDTKPRSITLIVNAIKSDLSQKQAEVQQQSSATAEGESDDSGAGTTAAETSTTAEEVIGNSSTPVVQDASSSSNDGLETGEPGTSEQKEDEKQKSVVFVPNDDDEEVRQLQNELEATHKEANELLEVLENTTLKERACVPNVCQTLQSHCRNALDSIVSSHKLMSQKVSKLEKRCHQDRLLAGGLSDSREKALSDAQRLLEVSLKSIETLSEALDRDVPMFVDETKQDDDEQDESMMGGAGVEVWTTRATDNDEGRGDDHLGPFDDEETRSFYCDIPDFLSTKPAALLGLTPAQVERKTEGNAFRYGGFEGNSNEEVGGGDGDGDGDNNDGTDLRDRDSGGVADPTTQKDDGPDTGGGTSTSADVDPTSTEQEGDQSSGSQFKLNVLLDEELLECNSREKADELAEKFCVNHGSSKNNRKRLSKALGSVPRTRLDLLAQYARVVCTIDHVYDDVAPTLVEELESQFHGQAKYKKNINLEQRIKIARFIGELTKFRTAPPIVALRCLKRCTDDLSGANIDVACSLLESCGRFLYRTKHTKQRLSKLLDVMTRIRKAKNLDERSVALLQSAFYMVNPPQRKAWKQTKVYSPLEAYIRYLFTVRLNNNGEQHNPTGAGSSTSPDNNNEATQTTTTSTTAANNSNSNVVSFITKQLLRLPWNDPTARCGYLVSKHLLKACFQNEHVGGSKDVIFEIMKSLKKSRREVCVRVVDMALDELQRSMEHPSFRNQQRAIGIARVLGGLHAASLISSSIIFEQLQTFIDFGHEVQPEMFLEENQSSKQNAAEQQQQHGNKLDDLSALKSSPIALSGTIPEDSEVGFPDSSTSTTNKERSESIENADHSASEPSSSRRPQYENPVPVSRTAKFDPRIPSVLDPPNSLLRVKLVCCLLESCGSSLVTTQSNLLRLRQFLTAFQRYLFTKSFLPVEVKFAVLDVFDSFDSYIQAFLSKGKSSYVDEQNKMRSSSSSRRSNNNKGRPAKNNNETNVEVMTTFVRYSSWADAHEATVQNEEMEAERSTLARQRLILRAGGGGGDLHSSLNSLPSVDDDDDKLGEDDSSSDEGDGDESEDDAHTQKSEDRRAGDEEEQLTTRSRNSQDPAAMTFDTEDSDNESGEGSYDDEDDRGDNDDDDHKEETASDIEANEKEALERQLEEEEFERELRKLTLEAVEKGKIAARAGTGGKVADTMVHASQFVSRKPHQQLQLQEKHHRDSSGELGGDSSTIGTNMFGSSSTAQMPGGISLKLLKKGNKGKVESKELIVPQNTSLAIHALKHGESEARERDLLKARVLQYEQESSLESSGNVYISQEKLQVIRNRPLLMDDIDRNFGTSSGSSNARDSSQSSHHHRGGSGRGRGRVSSRGRGGRTLKHY